MSIKKSNADQFHFFLLFFIILLDVIPSIIFAYLYKENIDIIIPWVLFLQPGIPPFLERFFAHKYARIIEGSKRFVIICVFAIVFNLFLPLLSDGFAGTFSVSDYIDPFFILIIIFGIVIAIGGGLFGKIFSEFFYPRTLSSEDSLRRNIKFFSLPMNIKLDPFINHFVRHLKFLNYEISTMYSSDNSTLLFYSGTPEDNIILRWTDTTLGVLAFSKNGVNIENDQDTMDDIEIIATYNFNIKPFKGEEIKALKNQIIKDLEDYIQPSKLRQAVGSNKEAVSFLILVSFAIFLYFTYPTETGDFLESAWGRTIVGGIIVGVLVGFIVAKYAPLRKTD